MEWRNRDWIWVVGILVALIILLISIFYADEKTIEVNFSIIASAVSIALALLAIFIALNQSRDNQELSTSLNVTMSIMNEKLNSVDEKVNKIDPDILVKVYRQKMDDVVTEVGKIVSNSTEISAKEIEEKYRNQLNIAGMEFAEIINEITESNNITTTYDYRPGDKVKHTKWGIGEITSVKGKGDSTEIDVVFSETVGKKRLLAKFAPVTKIV